MGSMLPKFEQKKTELPSRKRRLEAEYSVLLSNTTCRPTKCSKTREYSKPEVKAEEVKTGEAMEGGVKETKERIVKVDSDFGRRQRDLILEAAKKREIASRKVLKPRRKVVVFEELPLCTTSNCSDNRREFSPFVATIVSSSRVF